MQDFYQTINRKKIEIDRIFPYSKSARFDARFQLESFDSNWKWMGINSIRSIQITISFLFDEFIRMRIIDTKSQWNSICVILTLISMIMGRTEANDRIIWLWQRRIRWICEDQWLIFDSDGYSSKWICFSLVWKSNWLFRLNDQTNLFLPPHIYSSSSLGQPWSLLHRLDCFLLFQHWIWFNTRRFPFLSFIWHEIVWWEVLVQWWSNWWESLTHVFIDKHCNSYPSVRRDKWYFVHHIDLDKLYFHCWVLWHWYTIHSMN